MQAVVVHPEMIEERQRLGHDMRDEVWDGVLHMVPQPTSYHQRLGADLLLTLAPVARRTGLDVYYETTVYDPTKEQKNYRVPDVLIVDPAHVRRLGIEGRAELVIEILSPHDESREKLPFYAAHGTQEVWLIEREARTVEVFVLRADTYVAMTAEADGGIRAPRLGLVLRTVAGPKLRIEWADGAAEI